ncbi:hypothetical protein [Streptomyces sp. NPDC001480]|uniref:hypothetical protein n=1 Tax=Streptomyces sp. NPDC001480 TaxID=3364577 RepID=UPI0036AFAEA6
MDPYLVSVAGTAGTTVVTLLVQEGWQQTRDQVVALWRRFRPLDADQVGRELDASRQAAQDAEANGDHAASSGLADRWSRRFEGLLAEHPQAVGALSDLLGPAPRPAGQTVNGTVHLEGRAEGDGRVYQAARDQYVNER